MTLKDLKPALVWDIFDQITKVPRPSKKEEKIIEYLTPRLEADLGYYAAGDFINNLRKEFE